MDSWKERLSDAQSDNHFVDNFIIHAFEVPN